MAIKYDTNMRNTRLDRFDVALSTAPLLRIFTGSPPANCAAAQTGTLLVEMNLPTVYLAASSSGARAKTGTWQGTAVATGTAGYFRLIRTSDTTCHLQGTAGTSGTDMILDAAAVTSGQIVSVLTFTITAPGA